MKKKQKLPTNRYNFIIEKVRYREATWGETHGNNYRMNQMVGKDLNEGDPVSEVVFSKEYEIKEEAVVEILKALLKTYEYTKNTK